MRAASDLGKSSKWSLLGIQRIISRKVLGDKSIGGSSNCGRKSGICCTLHDECTILRFNTKLQNFLFCVGRVPHGIPDQIAENELSLIFKYHSTDRVEEEKKLKKSNSLFTCI